jgi:hypothetical protein
MRSGGFAVRILLPPREHGPPHVHVVKAGAKVVIRLGGADCWQPAKQYMANKLLTDQQILSQIPAARRRERRARATEARAVSARYDPRAKSLAIELTNGSSLRLPIKLIPWLRNVPANQLGEVEVDPSGEGLHWESLDVDLSVPGLLQEIFGTVSWMRQLASHGGRSRSPAKVRAAKSNGAKGGRPRGSSRRRRRHRVAA